jgi:hypothetical protein
MTDTDMETGIGLFEDMAIFFIIIKIAIPQQAEMGAVVPKGPECEGGVERTRRVKLAV